MKGGIRNGKFLHFFVPNHGKLWKSLMRVHLGEYESCEAQIKTSCTLTHTAIAHGQSFDSSLPARTSPMAKSSGSAVRESQISVKI